MAGSTFAEVADAARLNLFAANELLTQMLVVGAHAVDHSYIKACLFTNNRLVALLATAPTQGVTPRLDADKVDV